MSSPYSDRSKFESALGLHSYEKLHRDLWNSPSVAYLQNHPRPSSDSEPEDDPDETMLTYQSYDFSSLPCAVLPGGRPKFLVRQEYITLLEDLEKFYMKKDAGCERLLLQATLE